MPSGPPHSPVQPAGNSARDGWLRKHADYQRVYREGRRQSLPLMAYFFALRTRAEAGPGAEGQAAACSSALALNCDSLSATLGSRVGLTAGKVLGNAVERNRIKRRMRAAVRQHRMELTASVDVILHPRRTVLEADYTVIEREVRRVFGAVESVVRAGTPIVPDARRQRSPERPRGAKAATSPAKPAGKQTGRDRDRTVAKPREANPAHPLLRDSLPPSLQDSGCDTVHPLPPRAGDGH